ncbi:MAG: cell division protein FtsB [Gammaproteobacteria bacterium]|nr:cell division protein FtsB [Gammaproteobacteria bacterium]
MRLVIVVLAALFVMLQYALWFSDGGVFVTWKLQREIAAQVQENARLNDRNQTLAAEVVDLKQGLAAIEERARAELGMVKKGETFYQVVDPAVSPDKK